MTDVEQVARMLVDRGIEPQLSISRHEASWERDGVTWTYFGRIHRSREARLTAYRVTPEKAVEIATGEVAG